MTKPTITFKQAQAARKLLAEGNTADAIVMRALRKNFDTEELKPLNSVDPIALDMFLHDESSVEILPDNSINWSNYVVSLKNGQIVMGVTGSDGVTLIDSSSEITRKALQVVADYFALQLKPSGGQSMTTTLDDGSLLTYRPAGGAV